MDIEALLNAQSASIAELSCKVDVLTAAVQTLIQLIHDEDVDPEGEPELTLDGEVGSMPRGGGLDLG